MFGLPDYLHASWEAQRHHHVKQLDGDDLARIRSVHVVRGTRPPIGRMVPIQEIANVVDACFRDGDAAAAGVAAIIGCLYFGGCA